jgi:hypothetical protein
MLGWYIAIARQGERALKFANSRPADPNVLATWDASIGGLDWIDALVEQGKASLESRSGYPTRYTVEASAIMPLLQAQQVPTHQDFAVSGDDHVQPPGWIGNVHFHAERIADCTPEERLVIEAWDQS